VPFDEVQSTGKAIPLPALAELLDLQGSPARFLAADRVTRLPRFSPPRGYTKSVPAAAHRDRASKNRAGEMAKILIVDDEEINSRVLEKILQRHGHEIRMTCNSRDALQLAGNFRPDIVLTDILLPEIDGYELARLLKQQCPVKPRVIAVTGYSNEEADRGAFLDGFLVKPVSVEQLLQAIDSAALLS
jgi:CheY-like chemotaxis protein